MSRYESYIQECDRTYRTLIAEIPRPKLEELTMLLLYQNSINGCGAKPLDDKREESLDVHIAAMLSAIRSGRERMVPEHLRITVKAWVPGRTEPLSETRQFPFSDEYCDIMKWVMDATHKLIHD